MSVKRLLILQTLHFHISLPHSMPAYNVLLISRYIFCFHPLGALRLQSITLNLHRALCFMRSPLINQYLCQCANLTVPYRFVPCQTQFYHRSFFNLTVPYRFDTFARKDYTKSVGQRNAKHFYTKKPLKLISFFRDLLYKY